MPLEPEQISDLIKIGIPSLVAVATAIFAWLTQISLREKEKELYKLKFSIEKQQYLYEFRLKKVDQVIDYMGKYFSSWETVLTKLGAINPSKRDTVVDAETAWKDFSEVYKNKSLSVSILHTLGNISCLDLLNNGYKIYEELYNTHMEPNNYPSHEQLKGFGFRMGGIRNDFYREIGKLQNELATNV